MNAAMGMTDDPGDGSLLQNHQDRPFAGDLGDDDAVADELASPQEVGSALEDRSSIHVAATEAQLALWIEATADQDERALAALYDATFTHVFGLVRRIVHNTVLAEDVVQDTYFQVWRQALRFDPARGKPLAWLLAMARSRAIDALRREARSRHDTLDDEATPGTASAAPPVDELLDIARQHSDLHQAMMLLGAQPRQLVSMAFLRGLSHEEIAEQTQLPLGTVKSQIRRALLSLRQIVGANGTPALVS